MKRFSRIIQWAFSGSRSPARSDADKSAGWAEREVPLDFEWNEAEFSRDRLINDCATRADLLGPMPPGVSRSRLCAGLMNANEHWARPDSGYQYLQHSTTIVGSCLGWEWTTTETIYDTPILFFLDSNGFVYKVSNLLNAGESMTVTSALGLTYPYTAASVFDICCDSTYLYVLWHRASDEHLWVSRYLLTGASGISMTPSTSTDTGHTLTGSAALVGARMICADDNNLGLLIPYSTATFVGIMSKDGASYAEGQGNSLNYSPDGHLMTLVTDETRVYWLVSQVGTTEDTYVRSALISDPTTSDLTGGLIASTATGSPSLSPKGLFALPGVIVATDTTGRIWQYIIATDSSEELAAVDSRGTYPPSAEYRGSAIGCDGTGLWIQKPELGWASGASSESMSFHRIDMGRIGPTSNSSSSFPAVYGARVDVGVTNAAAGYTPGAFHSDGQSMYFVARAGYVLRIANPQGRV